MFEDIPIKIIQAYTWNMFDAYDWFYTGGHLLPHHSPDIDIIIVVPSHTKTGPILNAFGDDYKYIGFQTVICSEAYGTEEDSYAAVITLTSKSNKYDLLFIKSDNFNIMNWLKFYPLSIQRIAKSLKSGQIYKDPKQSSEQIIIYHNDPKFVSKYKKYYPEREFILKTQVAA